jgi:hypothetical protein
MGPLDDTERSERIKRSPYQGKYDKTVDRESAYELLKQRAARAAEQQRAEQEADDKSSSTSRSGRQSWQEAMLKSAARSAGTILGREGGKLLRGILGSLLGGK